MQIDGADAIVRCLVSAWFGKQPGATDRCKVAERFMGNKVRENGCPLADRHDKRVAVDTDAVVGDKGAMRPRQRKWSWC